MVQPNTTSIHSLTAIAGVAAALPLVFFVTSNVLKYDLGFFSGWEIPNIHPAILLGGALLALILNAWSTFDFSMSRRGRTIRVTVEFVARRWNFAVLALAALFILAVLLYLIVENVASVFGA